MTPFNLAGRTALVTGASQGIGESIARRLADAGARLVLAARSTDKLEALAEELRSAGAEAMPLTLDLSAPESIEASLIGLPEPFSAIDILVNNAGITEDKLLARMDLESWQRVLSINLTGAFAVTRTVCKGMMRRRWGRIISVSSVVGLMGNPGQANYAAAKAGLIGFSKSLARELASRGITVNVLAPGYIATAMTDALPENTKKSLESAIPLRRLGAGDDIAWAAVYLASEEAGYINGHVLNISGGLYI
jgi:3-oxoacyl-[acyl-carrier protein] reductase